ncbi:MAG: peptide chain release factor N(5)-glutamine methyltransferase [Acidimicrobiales bacterium]
MSDDKGTAAADPAAGDQEADDDLAGTVPWGDLADEVAGRLRLGGVDEADRHAHLIVMRACGADGGEWLTVSRQPATVRGVAAVDAMIARRLRGEPLQYVLAEWSFRHLDLYVDHRVLIPRPETEVVAGLALDELRRVEAEGGPVVAADLGTGSGAIGLSLVTEHPRVEVWLTDVSAAALAVARANLAGTGLAGGRCRVAEGWWFDALPAGLAGGLAVVVANPPYVADDDVLPPVVADWEPPEALFAGPAGTEHVDHLVETAPGWLAPRGALVLEMAPDQTGPVAERAAARFAEVVVERDLTGRARAVVARRPKWRAIKPQPDGNRRY